MKKRVSALLCLLLLTGCTNYNVNLSANVPSGTGASSSAVSSDASDASASAAAGSAAASAEGDAAGSASASAQAGGSEQGEAQTQSAHLDLDAADLWSEGAYSFQAHQDASYTVTREGEDDWNVYVLNQEFEDALRYLPQANESVVTNEGSFQVKAGQFVYCLSDVNSFTADEAPERGTSVLHLTLQ